MKENKFKYYVSVTVGNTLTCLFTHEKITNSVASTFMVTESVSADVDVNGMSKRVDYAGMVNGLCLIRATERKNLVTRQDLPPFASPNYCDNNPYNLPT
jgi:hypothetical protein